MKLAIYARVSSEKQEEQQTIQSQVAALREFAKANNHVIVEEYLDDGYSGELLARPALDRLRDDAAKKLFEAVLIHDPTRLSRRYINQGLVEEELKKREVRIIFLNRPDAKDTPEDNLLNGVQGLIAEYERCKILERTRRGKLHKAEQGILMGSRSPLGYRYIPANRATRQGGCYEIDEDDAKIVKLIFGLFIQEGLSIRGIAKELTRRGLSSKYGSKWHPSSLHNILTNSVYVGETFYNKTQSVEPQRPSETKYQRHKNTSQRLRPRAEWKPIYLPEQLHLISKQTFQAAQDRLVRNSQLSSRNTKHQYLLRGLIFCGACNSTVGGQGYRNWLYYRCRNQERMFPKPRQCLERSVKADQLEVTVWETLTQALNNPRRITGQLEILRQKAKEGSPGLDSELSSVELALHKLAPQRDRLLEAYQAGVFGLQELKDQMAKLDTKQADLNAQKTALLEKKASVAQPAHLTKTARENCQRIATRLREVGESFDGKRDFLLRIVERIILEGRTVRIQGVLRDEPTDETARIVSTTSRCLT